LSRGLNGWQRLWVVAAVMLLAAVTLSAQTFDNALAAYERGEFFVAADAFIKLAEQGDAKAQFRLGLMYYKGEGVRQDKVEAARLFRRAAEQGDAKAQFSLGAMYYDGDGVPINLTEAARLFHKAAEQGDAKAQFNLGVMWYEGHGVPKDPTEGARLFHKAAEQGLAEAQANLGILYYNGDGVQQDKAEAVRWLRKAAEQGDAEAQATLRRLGREQTPGVLKPRRAQSGVLEQRLGDHRPKLGVRGLSALSVLGGLLLFQLIRYLVKFYREHPGIK